MLPRDRVNDPGASPAERLEALAKTAGGEPAPPRGEEVNNHIHTIYSFSPYAPSMAALMAARAGLSVAGSVDHDSVGAAAEMAAACAALGLGSCAGFELRVSFAGTPFADRKLNNPDAAGIAYMTVQGIRPGALDAAESFLKPIRLARYERTKAMAQAASALFAAEGLGTIDFERDVVPLSKINEGGTTTERHLLLALALTLEKSWGRGRSLLEGLKDRLGIETPEMIAGFLSRQDNPHFAYDLLGALKAGFLPRIYREPGSSECPPARSVIAFAESIGAVSAYAYLGDVGESPTGDKKAELFEDAYLDELMPALNGLGYRAIAYMPPRNSPEQLERLRVLCERYGFLQISGVDINSSRQSFNCPELLRPEHAHLIESTWALVAHERLSEADPALGFFAESNPLSRVPLGERIGRYAKAGRSLVRNETDLASTMRAIGSE